MKKFVFYFLFVHLALADEHWFVFDQNQFPGFYSSLFTISASSNSDDQQFNQKNLSFALSTYERTLNVDVTIGNSNSQTKQFEQSIKLNVERADLLQNTFHHLIFISLRQRTKLETYVNCKLIDSYLLYSSNSIGEKDLNGKDVVLLIEKSTENIKHFYSSTDDQFHQTIFEKFACKHTSTAALNQSRTATIGRPLIRKMQHVIEKVQRRRLRSRRHQSQYGTLSLTTDSMTMIYKANLNSMDEDDGTFLTLVNVAPMAFEIRFYPREHLFHIRFNNENRTQFILYADKATDLANVNVNSSENSLVLFLHITPTIISCYVNCELTDQEFIIDSIYVQNILRQIFDRHQYADQQLIDYNRQSTLILFNQSIEQVASNFFCLKLDKKNEELLPDKYALRKFANALEMLITSLDSPAVHPQQHFYGDSAQQTTSTSTMFTTANVASINIHSINAFGNLVAPQPNTEATSLLLDQVNYEKVCQTDFDCRSSSTSLKCQQNHCLCPTRYFWSPLVRRCITCKDLSIGNRCFRFSTHKSTWYEANDFCQDETSGDEQPEYSMQLASNLNRTDIELVKRSLLQEDDGEQLDYFYWIGLTSQFDTRKLHQQASRNKRRVPTTIFRWYDNGETAQLNTPEIWCSQTDQTNVNNMNNNELCVSLTSCGLYADDCQRNYRFLCEAV